ncbi:hypothetical protein KAJ89_02415 [Candidatus Parcubacteria bacterium]|nr:hypothetical protein [Candidatus Parcubacteria bacterium]
MTNDKIFKILNAIIEKALPYLGHETDITVTMDEMSIKREERAWLEAIQFFYCLRVKHNCFKYFSPVRHHFIFKQINTKNLLDYKNNFQNNIKNFQDDIKENQTNNQKGLIEYINGNLKILDYDVIQFKKYRAELIDYFYKTRYEEKWKTYEVIISSMDMKADLNEEIIKGIERKISEARDEGRKLISTKSEMIVGEKKLKMVEKIGDAIDDINKRVQKVTEGEVEGIIDKKKDKSIGAKGKYDYRWMYS